jgi:alcohol dehydrogenase
MISRNLRDAVEDGANIEAVGNMLVASNVAGMAFATSRLGIVHAAALPLGAFFHVPHGVACTILLLHGIEFNMKVAAAKYRDIAEAMGEKTGRLSQAEAATVALNAVQKLVRDIGAPSRLSDVGVRVEAIPQMSRDAMKSSHIPANPRPILVQDIENLYSKAT